THSESRTSAWTFARDADGPAVHFGDSSHERQADTETAFRSLHVLRRLEKEVEHTRCRFRLESNAGIAHGQRRAVTVSLDLHVDAAVFRRVVHRVVDQVDYDLLDSRRVRAYPHRGSVVLEP